MKTIEVKPGGRHVAFDEVFLKGNPNLRVFEDGVEVKATKPSPKKRSTLSLKSKGKKK